MYTRKGLSLTYKFLIIMLVVVIIPAIMISYSSLNTFDSIENEVLESISEIQMVTEDHSDELRDTVTSQTRENLEEMVENELVQTRDDKIDRYSEILMSVEDQLVLTSNYIEREWESYSTGSESEMERAGIWVGPENQEELRDEHQGDINRLSHTSDLFEEIEDQSTFVDFAYIATPTNMVLTSTNINPVLEDFDSFSPVERPWYTLAEDEMDVSWITPYIDATTGDLTTTASNPVMVDDELVAIVGLDVYLDTMQEDLLDIDPGFAFLLDEEGEAVVYPGMGEGDEELTELGERTFEGLNLAEDEEVDEGLREIASDMVQNNEGLEIAEIDGEMYYVAYGPMETNEWSVGVSRPMEEVEEPIQGIEILIETNTIEMNEEISQKYESLSGRIAEQVSQERTNYIFLVIGFMVLVVLISFYFSKKITDPIKDLKDKAESISKGEKSEDLKIDTGDEIEELGDSFNRLMRTIKVLQKEDQE